jgi:RNA polymerase sigma-70 factor (ECF subfamily)
MTEADFPELLRRVRAGDARAAEDLFRHHEPQLRLEVRLRLRDPRLRRLLDEDDICQSVMLSFFIRARLGEYELAGPHELRLLLAGMARNKVALQARKQGAARRDFRRAARLEADVAATAGDSPSQVVAGEELVRAFRARLYEDERRIAELRANGRGWAEVAAVLGGSPDGRRVQFQRALGRVARELGLEEGTDE